MQVIKVEDLIRNYKKSIRKNKESSEDIEVLKGLNFGIEEHDFVGIMGKSGCGKTTLLKVLGLIDQPTKGKVYFKEKETQTLWGDQLSDIRRNEIGFIFQDFYLMDSLSVRENIMLPMILNQEDSAVMLKAADTYAIQFGLQKLLDKNPYELSGGEKQRVAICRALINDPDLILADEPTGNLDSKSANVVIDALQTINNEIQKTIVMVTHDPQVASYCKRIIFLKDGEILGTIQKGESREVFYQEIIKWMADL
ncbi:MAG: ABC transporter ATP-binding protein [Lachnospiraceae bacterium]